MSYLKVKNGYEFLMFRHEQPRDPHRTRCPAGQEAVLRHQGGCQRFWRLKRLLNIFQRISELKCFQIELSNLLDVFRTLI